MKKAGIICLVIAACMWIVRAANAIDFTLKDYNGTTHHLFEYCNAGKYTLLAFTSMG